MKPDSAGSPRVSGLGIALVVVAGLLVGAAWSASGARGQDRDPGSPPRSRLLGSVLDGEGKTALAGAKVSWVFDERPAHEARSARRQTASGYCDGNGGFNLPVPVGEGYFSVWLADRSPWVLLSGGIYPQDGWFDAGDMVMEVPSADREVRLHLLGPSGEAVADAVVRFSVTADGAPVEELGEARSDSAGRIRFGPRPYGDLWADISAPGLLTERVAVYEFPVGTGSAEETTVILARGATVEVRVTDDRDRVVADGWVAVSFKGSGDPPFDNEWYSCVGPDGTATVAVPASGAFTLQAGARGWKASSLDCTGLPREAVRIRLKSDL